MIRKTILISALAITIFSSCTGKKEKSEKEPKDVSIEWTSDLDNDAIINKVFTGSDGTKLEMTFNNAKGTVEIVFKGERSELISQKPASGIWYKNEHYELSGKGDDVELKKDGELVFSHKGEETITKSYVGKEGKEMTVNIYNSSNTATVVFQGEIIDLQGQKPASGIWYKNEHYELSGKGDDVELKKDGKTVFQSK